MSYALNASLWISSGDPQWRSRVLMAFSPKLNPELPGCSFINGRTIGANGLEIDLAIFEVDGIDNFIDYLQSNFQDDRSVQFTLEFPIEKVGTDRIITTDRSYTCEVRFFGRTYGFDHRNRFGDIEISFGNVGNFLPLSGLTASNLSLHARADIRSCLISENYRKVVQYLKLVASLSEIDHILLTTSDTDTNPLEMV